MLRYIPAVLVLLGPFATSLHARPHHRHHVRHAQHRTVNPHAGVSVYNSAAGPVTLAPTVAPRMLPFIAAVVRAGFRGPVHCYSPTGHVRNSLHHWGGACDFAQRGRGQTAPMMYHVASLAAQYGLRDGCTFRDCGHIDAGRNANRSRLAGNYRFARHRRRVG